MSRLSQGWLWTDFAALAITPALFTPLLFKFYLFLAMLVLHYCTWAFSSCREWGLLSSFSVWASHCSGFSCRGAWPLVRMGFIGARWKSSLYTHSLIGRGFHNGLGRQYLVLVVLPPWPPGRQISAPRGCIVHHQWELNWLPQHFVGTTDGGCGVAAWFYQGSITGQAITLTVEGCVWPGQKHRAVGWPFLYPSGVFSNNPTNDPWADSPPNQESMQEMLPVQLLKAPYI